MVYDKVHTGIPLSAQEVVGWSTELHPLSLSVSSY